MRTVYIDTVLGSASPTDPTQSNDAYDTWANFITGESAVTDDLTVNVTGTTDLGQITTASLSCATLTVVGEVNTPKWEANKLTVGVTDLSGILQTNSSLSATGAVKFRRLQIDLNITSNVTQAGAYGTYPFDLEACIIRRSDSYVNTGGEIRGLYAQTANARAFNCIFYNIDPAGAPAYAYGARRAFADDNFQIYNSILYNCGTGAQMNDASNVLVNCILGSNDNPSYGDVRDASGTIDYNFSIDADAHGANGTQVLNQATMDAYFTDPANGDFTLTAAGQTALAGQGQSDPASGAFSDDITGATRTGAWTVGPLQVVAVPVISSPTITPTTSQVDFQVSTDTTSGTLYAVFDTAGNMSGITASQIKAGTNASDAAPVGSASGAISASPVTISDTGLALPNSTTYSYAIIQNDGSNDSNILTGTFSTPGLEISSVTDPLVPGSSATAAVTLAGTTQGVAKIIDSDATEHSATITTWPTGTGDGNVIFDVPSVFTSNLKPGVVTVEVENSGNTDSHTIGSNLNLDAGFTQITVVSQNTSADSYLTASTAPVAGDLVAHHSFLRNTSDDSETAYAVTVVADGLYYTIPNTVPTGSYYFDFYVYDQGDGTWGTAGRESISITNADVIPNQFTLISDDASAELSTLYSGSFVVSGTTPGVDLTVNAGGSMEVSSDDVTYGASATVQNGSTVYYRLTSSASYETLVTGSVTINGISDSVNITTRAAVTPTITTQPSADPAEVGESVSLVVSATNVASYQWYKNDSPVSGETGATYTFTAALADDGATYYVILTSSEGGTTQSSSAVLSVSANAAPTITGSATHTVNENAAFSATYTIANRDGNAPTLSGADSSQFSLVNTSGDSYTLSMTAKDYESPVDANADNVYEVTLNINDGVNAAVTLDVTVTVQNITETFWAYTPPQYRIVRFKP